MISPPVETKTFPKGKSPGDPATTGGRAIGTRETEDPEGRRVRGGPEENRATDPGDRKGIDPEGRKVIDLEGKKATGLEDNRATDPEGTTIIPTGLGETMTTPTDLEENTTTLTDLEEKVIITDPRSNGLKLVPSSLEMKD